MRTEQRLPQCRFSRFICLCQGHKCRSNRKVTGVHRTRSLSGREQSAWQPWRPSCRRPWPWRPPTCPCGKPRPSPSSWSQEQPRCPGTSSQPDRNRFKKGAQIYGFKPTSCPSLPREQNLLPCFSLRTCKKTFKTVLKFSCGKIVCVVNR